MICRKSTVTVRAQQQPNQKMSKVTSYVQGFRKGIEESRAPVAKDSWNKVAMIASADVKFANDLIKDLDKLHKGIFELWKSGDDTTTDVTVTTTSENRDNIFKQ